MQNLTATNLKEALEMEPNKILLFYNTATDRLDKLLFQEGSSTPCEANPPKAATTLVGDADDIQVDNTLELATLDRVELNSTEIRSA